MGNSQIKKIIFAMLIALFVLSACTDTIDNKYGSITISAQADQKYYSSSNSKTVMPDFEEFTPPGYYTIKLIDKDGKEKTADVSNSDISATFSNLIMGSYTIKAYGYNDENRTSPIAFGESSILVQATEENKASVSLSPISDKQNFPEAKGTVSIDFSWDIVNPDITITEIRLVDSATGLSVATQQVDNSVTEVRFSQLIPVGLNQHLYFEFYSGSDFVANTGEEVFNIYADQIATTDCPDNYTNLYFQMASNVKNFTIEELTDLNSLTYSFTMPRAFETITVTCLLNNETVETHNISISDFEAKPAYGTKYSGKFTELNDNTEYTIKVQTTLADSVKSATYAATKTTAIPLTSITEFTYSQDELDKLAPKTTLTLTPVYNPENATDLGGVWTSSDTSVATVENGLVSGVGFGNAVITYIPNNNPTGTISIEKNLNIRIEAPVLSVEQSGSELIASWNTISNVDGYNIYKDGSLVAVVTDTSYAFKNLTKDVIHSFYVEAYKGSDKSAPSNAVETALKFEVPTLSVTTEGTSITLAWNEVANVAGYKLYRDGVELTDYTDGVSYTDNNALSDETYSYYVIAYNGEYESAPSETKTASYSVSSDLVFTSKEEIEAQNENNEYSDTKDLIIKITPANAKDYTYSWNYNGADLAPTKNYITIPSDSNNNGAREQTVTLTMTKDGVPPSEAELKFYFVDVVAAIVKFDTTNNMMNNHPEVDAVIRTHNETGELTLVANVFGEDGVTPATRNSVVYTSEDVNIATINNAGEVQIVNNGVISFTATAPNGVTGTIRADIAKPVTSVVFTQTHPTIFFSQTDFDKTFDTKQPKLFAATANGKYGDVIFESSDQTTATVDSEGTVTPVAQGKAKIIAKSADNENIKTEIEVIVKEVAVFFGTTNFTGQCAKFGDSGWFKEYTKDFTIKIWNEVTSTFDDFKLANYTIKWEKQENKNGGDYIRINSDTYSPTVTIHKYGITYNFEPFFIAKVLNKSNEEVFTIRLRASTTQGTSV